MASDLEQLDRQLCGEIWTSQRAHNDLRQMCDFFGHRFAGSPGERGAALFLQAKLREYGLEAVTAEPGDAMPPDT